MRVIKGLIHKNEYTLCHPFRALISGSSGKRILKAKFIFLHILTIKILISSGKTKFVENLIKFKKLGFQPRRILYLYPEGL